VRRRLLVRTDSAGATQAFLAELRTRKLQFSVGLAIDAHVGQALLALPEHAWRPAIAADGRPRDGAWVAEVTGWLDLSSPASRPAPAVSAAASVPTPAPRQPAASPTLKAAATRSFSPASPAATSPAWSCATASTPASKTASAPPFPPPRPPA